MASRVYAGEHVVILPTLGCRRIRHLAFDGWPSVFGYAAGLATSALVLRPLPVGGGFAAAAVGPALPGPAADEAAGMRAGWLAIFQCLDAIHEDFAHAGCEHLRFFERRTILNRVG